MDADFAHTETAEQRRADKARALAKHLYEHGVSVVDAIAMSGAERRQAARAVDVHPPSAETWAQTCDRLARAHDLWGTPPAVAHSEEATGRPQPSRPVPPQRPARAPVACARCATSDGVSLYPSGYWCWPCSPRGRTGKPPVTPDPNLTLDAIRARSGQTFGFRASDTALVDERAVASGKRRAAPNQQRAARAAQEARRAATEARGAVA